VTHGRTGRIFASHTLAASVCLTVAAAFVAAQAPAPTAKPAKKTAARRAPAPERTAPDPKAVEILKAACDKLAAAGSMSFTALGAYEVPSPSGPPLIYGRIYEVTLQRPDKLAVLTIGDGPRTEFYDDGKVMMSFHPAENLVAVADAGPSIDASLEKLYGIAGTYFPFTDIIVANPWKDIESDLVGASYVGESMLVGGTTTDVIAYESPGVFIQMWIGREDKLPYMARATYLDDPLQLRHSVQFSKWQLDPAVAPEAFTTTKAAGAATIPFSNPKMKSDLPSNAQPIGVPKKPAPRPKKTPNPQ
jgi:hypothetical protein